MSSMGAQPRTNTLQFCPLTSVTQTGRSINPTLTPLSLCVSPSLIVIYNCMDNITSDFTVYEYAPVNTSTIAEFHSDAGQSLQKCISTTLVASLRYSFSFAKNKLQDIHVVRTWTRVSRAKGNDVISSCYFHETNAPSHKLCPSLQETSLWDAQ
jgi:hypothetical protein